MTADQFRELLAELIATANDDGLSYEATMAGLRETVAALDCAQFALPAMPITEIR